MRSVSPRWPAVAAVLLAWVACSSVTTAQVELDLEDFPGLPDVMDPGRPRTTFRLLNLVVSSNREFAFVQYTQQTDDGPLLTRIGWIFLSNDRRINYKMTMIAMLRDALDDPDRQVSIGIVPGTENTTRRIVAAVALGPASE